MLAFSPKRFEQARLAANMSRGDLAHEIRLRAKSKASERHVAGWEKGEYEPSGTVVAAVARATGKDIEFFYEQGGEDDLDEEAAQVTDALLDRLVEKRVQQRLRELGRLS